MKQAVRDAPIGFMADTAQAQLEASKETQKAGIEHAKAVRTPIGVGSPASLTGKSSGSTLALFRARASAGVPSRPA